MLRGALAAAVTPLDGDRIDEPAFGPYVDFLAGSGLDGLLALGTTGEGLLFGVEERKRTLELFLEATGDACRSRRTAVPRRRRTPSRSPLMPPRRAPMPSR